MQLRSLNCRIQLGVGDTMVGIACLFFNSPNMRIASGFVVDVLVVVSNCMSSHAKVVVLADCKISANRCFFLFPDRKSV